MVLCEVLWLFLSAGEPLACTHPWTVQPLWTAPSARQGVPDGRFEICSHSAEGVALAWFFCGNGLTFRHIVEVLIGVGVCLVLLFVYLLFLMLGMESRPHTNKTHRCSTTGLHLSPISFLLLS